MKHAVIMSVALLVATAVCNGQPVSGLPDSRIIALPRAVVHGPLSFEQVLSSRRQVRQFTREVLDSTQIGQLLWAGQGIIDPNQGLRTAHSIANTFPLELHLATGQGTFVYDPLNHSLQRTSVLDIRPRLAAISTQRQMVADAPCDIIIAGSTRKMALQIGARARQYIYLEAGQTAQNIQLQATAIGLASVEVDNFDAKAAGRLMRLARGVEPMLIVCAGYPIGAATSGGLNETAPVRVLLIIPSQKFRDEELFETREQLEQARFETVLASTRLGMIRGMLGGKADATLLVNEVNVADFDAVVFIGGVGAQEYFNNAIAMDIASRAVQSGKLVGAISVAPTILANAGLMDGRVATAFPTQRTALLDAGADYTGDAVERDGSIITASGPAASKRFGQAIVDYLSVSPLR